jgi:pyruvate ferredoxin oxidoreductase gamma subunit
MFQIRIHGRGGQGVVSAAEILSFAAFLEGKHAQAFPSFGSERTGAPVVAFCRIDNKPIRLREPVVRPDALIVQDVTLLGQIPLIDDVGPEAYVLINSPRSMGSFLSIPGVEDRASERWRTVPATELATQYTGLGLPNAALLGGFAALTGQLGADSICEAICQKFPGQVGKSNAAAAMAAFELLSKETVYAQAD